MPSATAATATAIRLHHSVEVYLLPILFLLLTLILLVAPSCAISSISSTTEAMVLVRIHIYLQPLRPRPKKYAFWLPDEVIPPRNSPTQLLLSAHTTAGNMARYVEKEVAKCCLRYAATGHRQLIVAITQRRDPEEPERALLFNAYLEEIPGTYPVDPSIVAAIERKMAYLRLINAKREYWPDGYLGLRSFEQGDTEDGANMELDLPDDLLSDSNHDNDGYWSVVGESTMQGLSFKPLGNRRTKSHSKVFTFKLEKKVEEDEEMEADDYLYDPSSPTSSVSFFYTTLSSPTSSYSLVSSERPSKRSRLDLPLQQQQQTTSPSLPPLPSPNPTITQPTPSRTPPATTTPTLKRPRYEELAALPAGTMLLHIHIHLLKPNHAKLQTVSSQLIGEIPPNDSDSPPISFPPSTPAMVVARFVEQQVAQLCEKQPHPVQIRMILRKDEQVEVGSGSGGGDGGGSPTHLMVTTYRVLLQLPLPSEFPIQLVHMRYFDSSALYKPHGYLGVGSFFHNRRHPAEVEGSSRMDANVRQMAPVFASGRLSAANTPNSGSDTTITGWEVAKLFENRGGGVLGQLLHLYTVHVKPVVQEREKEEGVLGGSSRIELGSENVVISELVPLATASPQASEAALVPPIPRRTPSPSLLTKQPQQREMAATSPPQSPPLPTRQPQNLGEPHSNTMTSGDSILYTTTGKILEASPQLDSAKESNKLEDHVLVQVPLITHSPMKDEEEESLAKLLPESPQSPEEPVIPVVPLVQKITLKPSDDPMIMIPDKTGFRRVYRLKQHVQLSQLSADGETLGPTRLAIIRMITKLDGGPTNDADKTYAVQSANQWKGIQVAWVDSLAVSIKMWQLEIDYSPDVHNLHVKEIATLSPAKLSFDGGRTIQLRTATYQVHQHVFVTRLDPRGGGGGDDDKPQRLALICGITPLIGGGLQTEKAYAVQDMKDKKFKQITVIWANHVVGNCKTGETLVHYSTQLYTLSTEEIGTLRGSDASNPSDEIIKVPLASGFRATYQVHNYVVITQLVPRLDGKHQRRARLAIICGIINFTGSQSAADDRAGTTHAVQDAKDKKPKQITVAWADQAVENSRTGETMIYFSTDIYTLTKEEISTMRTTDESFNTHQFITLTNSSTSQPRLYRAGNKVVVTHRGPITDHVRKRVASIREIRPATSRNDEHAVQDWSDRESWKQLTVWWLDDLSSWCREGEAAAAEIRYNLARYSPYTLLAEEVATMYPWDWKCIER